MTDSKALDIFICFFIFASLSLVWSNEVISFLCAFGFGCMCVHIWKN